MEKILSFHNAMCLGSYVIRDNRIGIVINRKYASERKREGEEKLSRLTYSLRSHIASRAPCFTFWGRPHVAPYPKRWQIYGKYLGYARIKPKNAEVDLLFGLILNSIKENQKDRVHPCGRSPIKLITHVKQKNQIIYLHSRIITAASQIMEIRHRQPNSIFLFILYEP